MLRQKPVALTEAVLSWLDCLPAITEMRVSWQQRMIRARTRTHYAVARGSIEKDKKREQLRSLPPVTNQLSDWDLCKWGMMSSHRPPRVPLLFCRLGPQPTPHARVPAVSFHFHSSLLLMHTREQEKQGQLSKTLTVNMFVSWHKNMFISWFK